MLQPFFSFRYTRYIKVSGYRARSLPWRIVLVSARSPNAILKASRMSDFPAPVSPVIAVVPPENLSQGCRPKCNC